MNWHWVKLLFNGQEQEVPTWHQKVFHWWTPECLPPCQQRWVKAETARHASLLLLMGGATFQGWEEWAEPDEDQGSSHSHTRKWACAPSAERHNSLHTDIYKLLNTSHHWQERGIVLSFPRNMIWGSQGHESSYLPQGFSTFGCPLWVNCKLLWIKASKWSNLWRKTSKDQVFLVSRPTESGK